MLSCVVLWSRVMVWSLWARSVSLVRSALGGGGSDCRGGPMVVRREDSNSYHGTYLLRLHGSPLLRAIGAPSAGVFLFP